MEKHKKENVVLSQQLRKNMTPEEKKLWYEFLKNHPACFKRQKVLGPFIADFYCAKAKLVIELDGRQHYTENGRAYDESRTEYLHAQGLKVLRFKNYQIRDHFPTVCEEIDLFLSACITVDPH